MKRIYSSLLIAAALGAVVQNASAQQPHPDPIITAPEGRTVEYTMSGYSYSTANYDYVHSFVEGKTGTAVWTDDNEVYFKDFMLTYNAGTMYYIKGRVEGDEVIIDFPQSISSYAWSGGVDWHLVQLLEKTAEPEEEGYFPNYTVVSENNRIVFKIEDGNLVMQQKNNDYIVGITDCYSNYSWVSNGDYQVEWKPFGETVQTPPSTITLEEGWEFIASGNGKDVTVGIDGNDFWMKGFSTYLPDAWVKGTIDGDKVTFTSGQYLGIDEDYNHADYFVAATIEQIDGEYMFVRSDDIVFDYDLEAKSMSSKASILVNTNDTDYIRYLEAYQQPIIRVKRTEIESYVPANPVIIAWNDPDPTFKEYSSFNFELPRTSVKDDLLDTSNLYYRIYTNDDALFVFYPDDYNSFIAPHEEIAWEFNDNNDIIADGTYHLIYFQVEGIDRIGVQSIYNDGEKEFSTPIIYNKPLSVESFEADDEVVATEMYDLHGRKVVNPENGIYVVRERHANGSYSSRKIVRR